MNLFDLSLLSPEIVAATLLFSGVTFVGTLLIIPWILTRIPERYFCGDNPPPSVFKVEHPALGLLWMVLRNTLGLILMILGILMLVLPGQGLLTLVAASFLLQFPRKYRLQRWIVRRPAVLKSINWLRGRYHKPALKTGG